MVEFLIVDDRCKRAFLGEKTKQTRSLLLTICKMDPRFSIDDLVDLLRKVRATRSMLFPLCSTLLRFPVILNILITARSSEVHFNAQSKRIQSEDALRYGR